MSQESLESQGELAPIIDDLGDHRAPESSSERESYPCQEQELPPDSQAPLSAASAGLPMPSTQPVPSDPSEDEGEGPVGLMDADTFATRFFSSLSSHKVSETAKYEYIRVLAMRKHFALILLFVYQS